MKRSSTTTKKLFTFKTIRKKCYYYLEESRPGGWIINAVFLLMGEWYSLGKIPLSSTLIALFAIVGITSAGSWINFVFDRKLDEFAGKDVSFFAKNISPKEMSLFFVMITVLSLILLLYVNLYVFSIGVLMSIIFLIYSAPPIRLKTRPPLDCISNALVFGTMPFFMGWMINVKWLNQNAFLYGIIISLAIIFYYLILSSFDINKDKEYGIKTSCTKLGFRNSINAGILIFIIMLLLSIIFLEPFSILTVAFLITFPFILIMKLIEDETTLRILLSIVYYLLAEIVLLMLFIYTHSKIPLIMFVLVLIIGIYVICLYQYIKKSKSNVHM